MQEYARCFNREIDGRPINISDIKYFAKIEIGRAYTGTDKEIRENQSYAIRILALKQEIQSIESGQKPGNIQSLNDEIQRLEKQAPHQLHGKRIVRGMPKPGPQSHVHIIVSRKDASNRYSLSPGSRYKASETALHGQKIKRGFDRNAFFTNAEKKFDTLFQVVIRPETNRPAR